MNEKEQILEIINGFKNLTSRIKKDNDEMKDSMKNKEVTITARKKEYRKLYQEHEELKQKYLELQKYFEEENKKQREKQQVVKNSSNKRKKIQSINKIKKKNS